jgi:hypothetical protein
MKILTLDIETSPNLAHVWRLWQENVGLNQLLEASEVLCFAAKWLGDDEVFFASQYEDGKYSMVRLAHALLDEADVVVHYNGARFDIPHLNREFISQGLTPPSPYKQVDLLRTVKRQFRFPSNKLDYVCQALELGAKTQHTGHQLWVDCLSGDPDAWELMQEYNEHDVVITEKLYLKLLPWIISHPTVGLYEHTLADEPRCPACDSDNLERRGKAVTQVSVYQRFRCRDCGKWSRGGTKLTGVDVRGVTS